MMYKRMLLALAVLACCVAGVAALPQTLLSTSQSSRVAEASASAALNALEETARVIVSNVKFEPKTITVKAGTTVVWENKEGAHTVTSDKGLFASPTLSAGQSFSHKFTKQGRYPYHCSFHGSKGGHDMAGTVIVTP